MRDGNFISRKISCISFFAMLCVLWWHSASGSVIEEYFIPSVCVWSIPWFFFASGLFFWKSLRGYSISTFLQKKVRSLVIPYVLWAIIGCLVSYSTDPGGNIGDLFAFVTASPKWNRPLWYLRALIILCFLGALVRAMLLKCKVDSRVGFLIVFLAVVIPLHKYMFPIWGPNSTPLYFGAGILLSDIILDGRRIVKYRNATGIVALTLALLCRGCWFAQGYRFHIMGGTILANFSVICFIFAIWMLMDGLVNCFRENKVFSLVCSMCSFVYFAHGTSLNHLGAFYSRLDPNMAFILMAISLPAIFLTLGLCLKKWFPRVYGTLSGGR